MRKLTIGIIGCGNIAQTRHIPTILRHPRFELIGVVDRNSDKLEILKQKFGLTHGSKLDFDQPQKLKNIDWLKGCDLVLIAAPPKYHAKLVEAAIMLHKHILVEKPFVLDLHEGEKLIKLAEQEGVFLAVNHNFQFASAFTKLETDIAEGKLGRVESFYLQQFSNKTRRLPVWGDSLPLGLFYDESPHFFYLLQKFAGPNITIDAVFARGSKKLTPELLSVDFHGQNPGHIFCNFNAPICEWNFIVVGTKAIANCDLFRDIYTVLPNDGLHLGKTVLRTSLLATWQHWRGVIMNGFLYLSGKLDYGFTKVYDKLALAITTEDSRYLKGITAKEGLAVNQLQQIIVAKADTFLTK